MMRGWKPAEIGALPPATRAAVHWGLWAEYWADEYPRAKDHARNRVRLMLFPSDEKADG
jgi:hypothetical protein